MRMTAPSLSARRTLSLPILVSVIIVVAVQLVQYSDAFIINNRNDARISQQQQLLGGAGESAVISLNKPIGTSSPNKHTTTNTQLNMIALPSSASGLIESLFAYNGNVPILQAASLNLVLFLALRPKLLKILTEEGFWNAFALGTGLWATLGWRGWTLCVGYLLLGSAVTKVRFEEKEKRGIAEGRGGRRGPENTWGSAMTALICAICSVQGAGSFLGIPSELFVLGYVASLSTKLSDTFASEIGKAYGKTTFLITTLERVEPGTEGAISAEGTAASVVGGSLLTLYGYAVGLIPAKAIPISIIAAFIATNIESVLGATLQDKKNLEWITNDVVNFINTLIGAAIAIVAGMSFL